MAGACSFSRDVANVTMDLNDVETIEFKALGGADTITINDLAGTDCHSAGWWSISPARSAPARATARWTRSP